MDPQCNLCGSFNDPQPCERCHITICKRCAYNHELGCERRTKMEAMGLGPTVRTTLRPLRVTETMASDGQLLATLTPEPEPVATSPAVIIFADAIDNFVPPAEPAPTSTKFDPKLGPVFDTPDQLSPKG
jgi:hypothetical protein